MAQETVLCMSLLHTEAVRPLRLILAFPFGGKAWAIEPLLIWYFTDEVLDVLLDQEGLEIELTDRIEGDLPLHKAVRYVNSLSQADWPAGAPIVEILLDAGCDPRIRNKAKLKPIELVDPRNTELREVLRKGEVAMMMGGDVVEDDEGPTGSASDSD